MSTGTATSPSRVARRGPTAPVCSPRETWSTTPTARRSRRPARAVRRRSTPSGTSETHRRCPPRRGCLWVTWPRRNGRLPQLRPRRSKGALASHQAAQRWSRAVALLPILLPEAVQHGEYMVEPDLIGPRERAARIVEPEHHAGVDVLCAAHAFTKREGALVDHLAEDSLEHAAARRLHLGVSAGGWVRVRIWVRGAVGIVRVV